MTAADVFASIEAHVVAIGEFLEKARRYRPLAHEAERLYREAARIASEVRRTSRSPKPGDDPAGFERRLAEIAASAGKTLDDFLASERYRAVVDVLASGGVTATRLAELFADVEPAAPRGRLHLPVTAKRGEKAVEPEAAAETLERMVAEGIEPQRGPGVGSDETIRPIRFFENLVGLDAALLVIVDGEAIDAPSLRAAELGEILVYTPCLKVPFVVGLRAESPDDWLDIGAGGYPKYRERCRELITARGITVETL